MTGSLLHTVVSVGQYPPRWMYCQALDEHNVRGRIWIVPDRRGQAPHWSRTKHVFSRRRVNQYAPAEPKPEPPR